MLDNLHIILPGLIILQSLFLSVFLYRKVAADPKSAKFKNIVPVFALVSGAVIATTFYYTLGPAIPDIKTMIGQ